MGCGSSKVSWLGREEPCGGCKAVLSLGGAAPAPASPHSSPIHAAFTHSAGQAASLHSSADGYSPPPKPAAAAAFSHPPTEQAGAPLASAFASAAAGGAAASGIQYGISPQDSCKHETEAERLAVLRALHVTHQPSGPRFGSITAVLRGLFQLPVASVYLLEEDEVLVVPEEEGISPWEAHPRCESVCKWVTGQLLPPELLIIEDLSKDLRFCRSRWVAQPPHVRFMPPPHFSQPTEAALRHAVPAGLPAPLLPRRSLPDAGPHGRACGARAGGGQHVMWNALALEEARSGVRRLIRGLDCFTEAVLLCDIQAEEWPIRYANTAAAKLVGLLREQVERSRFWDLLRLMPETGSVQSQEEVLAAVRSSQGCSFGCNMRAASTRQSSADTAGTAGCGSSIVAASNRPTPGRMQSASSAGWDQLERVLSGLASLEALLPSCEHPDFTVTAIPASTHQQRANEPAIGIPALCASWPGSEPPKLKSCASCRDCSSASGGAGCSGGMHNSSDAAYKDSYSSSGRFWLLSLRPHPKAPLARTGGGCGCHPDAVSAESAASLEYLCPGDLDVQLGPLLGVGGSGRTYRGLWFGSAVAVKIFNVWESKGGADGGSEDSTAAGGAAEPVLEALLSRALAHPHIVQTHTWGVGESEVDDNGKRLRQVWILQALCSLGTLGRAIDSGRFLDPTTGGPDIRAVLLTACEIAGALTFLHGVGVIHGDMGTNNVLLCPSERSGRDAKGYTAKVSDFGLSRPTTSASLNNIPRTAFGTVVYMAPELMADDVMTAAADTFALGVLIWEMMRGQRAWRGMGPLQVVAAVSFDKRSLEVPHTWPEGVQALVRGCLDANPARRPSAAGILERVQALLRELEPHPEERESKREGVQTERERGQEEAHPATKLPDK